MFRYTVMCVVFKCLMYIIFFYSILNKNHLKTNFDCSIRNGINFWVPNSPIFVLIYVCDNCSTILCQYKYRHLNIEQK
jgi:hypothetical protein